MSALHATDFVPAGPMPSPLGREQAFNRLVMQFTSDLKRYAYWLSGDHSIADDLVQDTLLRAWRSLSQLRDPKAVKGWLLTTLRRENARRFERIQPNYSDIELDTLCADGIGAEVESDTEVMRDAIRRLPKAYREPLLLQIVGGYGYDEIADMLGVTQSAVTSRLFRARQKLCEMLASSYGHADAVLVS
ncbi:MAG: sigma-70 family RNA polymerase sigma factor [Gammaproteobacteria bacterium]|nr:sigma-70 family RNA polymerase sigma factor [Gammaproteobacteria bacterium]MCP5135825.1 sigma-70 family RNA polymerase sigma factor [Gammaproteobacteria bacterium]